MKKSKGRVLFIDGNWYLHRCFSVVRDVTTRPLEDVLPMKFLSMVLKDAVAVKAERILVGFDGHKVFRFDVYPEYKASRVAESSARKEEEGYKDLYVALPNVRKLFARVGIHLMQHSKYEADDIWASVATQYPKLGYSVVGGGKDKDGYQNLGPDVRLYDSSFKPEPRYITAERAEKIKGVPVAKMTMFQTLLGDKIDDIPQVLSPAKAKAVCLAYDSVRDWYSRADKETRKFINANQARLIVNNKLVTLKRDLALPDPELLKPAKNKHLDLDMPKWWFAHQDMCWPKSKGLFSRR